MPHIWNEEGIIGLQSKLKVSHVGIFKIHWSPNLSEEPATSNQGDEGSSGDSKFGMYDKDNDGSIDKSELANYLVSLDDGATEEDLNVSFLITL